MLLHRELASKLKDRRSRAIEWEEWQRFCTKELVMLEVAMKCQSNRFCTRDRPLAAMTVSLEQVKETLYSPNAATRRYERSCSTSFAEQSSWIVTSSFNYTAPEDESVASTPLTSP